MIFRLFAWRPSGSRTSLRVRLTVWTMGIFVVVQASIGYAYHVYQARRISEYFDVRIRGLAGQMVPRVAPMLSIVDDATLSDMARDEFAMLMSESFVVNVRNGKGDVIAASRRPEIPVSASLLERARAATGEVTASFPGSVLGGPVEHDETARGLVQRVEAGGETYFFVLAARDDHARNMVALLQRTMVFGLPIGLIAVAISAYVITGIAVRPITELVATVRRLSPASIGEHVESRGAWKEVDALRNELEKARARLEAGFSAQERFISNVSHEIKTPLAVVLTQAQVLPKDALPASAREFVRSTTEELEKLSRTVDSFLLLTRARDGKDVLPRFTRMYVRDILLDSLEGCSRLAKQYGVRIDLTVPEGDDTDLSTAGNADLLRTIVDNLVRNALRFSPRGGVVDVRARRERNLAIITVRDRGPGISVALLPKIFDRFTQAKEEQARGTGLGLAIAQGLAELHGGVISVANCSDGGCEFTVSLPASGIAGAE